MLTEADTCRQYVTPALYAAGWADEQIREQHTFTDGRIISHGDRTRATRQKGKRADYLLRLTRDRALAVVEAKPLDESAATGVQQAKDYAEIVGISFAYATNGTTIIAPLPQRSRKIYFDGGQVEIIAELVHELDSDGKQLRVVKLTDYTAEKVRTLYATPGEFRARWADTAQRADILQKLAERGIDYATVAAQAKLPDADPFDLLCHLAYNAPLLTRRQRADRVKKQEAAFCTYYTPEAREILAALLEKYAADGELQFTLPDILKVPPLSAHGNVAEIINKFGTAENLRNAVNKLKTLLYIT